MSTTTNTFAETTIVAFHIGRGGHFNNPGHISFLGEYKIGKYTDDLFISFENAWEVGKAIGDRENLKSKLEKAFEGDDDAVAFFENIGLPLGDKCYTDGSGHSVGLTVAEAEAGVGRIEIDGGYNTTYTKPLSDCNERELQLIIKSDLYVPDAIVDYAKEQLGVTDEEETEDEE